MAATDARQFGTAAPGRDYADRPTAFGVAERAGRIALVHIRKPEASYHDLPGGALDPGETEPEALVREFGEETGLRVRAGDLFTRAGQFMIKDDGQAVNNRCAFFIAEVESQDATLKIEDDHTLVWTDAREALTLLRHDAHAWAVLAWLRRRDPV
jgi:8-oxo-dGTP diphosphatase